MSTFFRCVPRGQHLAGGDPDPVWAFKPNSGDAKAAAQRGIPIRVTVWDIGLTTLPNIAERRATKQEYRAYTITDTAIAAVSQRFQRPDLRLVPDPMDGPGGAGHYGLEGCGPYRDSRDQDKKIRAALAEALVPA